MKRDIIKLNEGQWALCLRLARKLCANYDGGNCLLLDDGDTFPCAQLIGRYAIYCSYFKEAVLPADEALLAELTGSARKKRCTLCGKPFVPTSNRQKFCPACSVLESRRRDRQRKRQKRQGSVRF